VLFYASPVLYPVEKLPSTIGDILQLNPFTPLLELARVWVIDPTAPTPVEVAGGFVHLLPAIAIYLATCIFAVWTFRREAPRIAEQL
jgi:ABC-2 type transport system permease protein